MISQNQLTEYGRNFYFVREFKNQIDKFWNNSGEKYYLTIEDKNYEHQAKVYSRFQLASMLAVILLIFLFFSWVFYKCRKRFFKKKKKDREDQNEKFEDLLKNNDGERGANFL